jgi:hypothetical protein
VQPVDEDNVETYHSSQKESNEVEFSVYPNPTTDELNLIVTDKYLGKNYQIFSTNGAVVKSGKIESFKTQFSVAGLAKGAYSIKIADLDQVIKFVKK